VNAPTRRSPTLEITQTHTPTTTTLKLSGELDLPASVTVIEVTRRALRQRPALLRLDLRDVEFLDISGARALIHCRRLASAADTSFQLTDLSAPVRRLLDISRLRAVFEIELDEQDVNGHVGQPHRGQRVARHGLLASSTGPATSTTAKEDADADDDA
jgi:anti-anti-sigma factor